jgi:hypothetical protein
MNRVCPNVHHENITLWLAIEIYSLPVSSARGEDLKKIGQSETRIACGGHVC